MGAGGRGETLSPSSIAAFLIVSTVFLLSSTPSNSPFPRLATSGLGFDLEFGFLSGIPYSLAKASSTIAGSLSTCSPEWLRGLSALLFFTPPQPISISMEFDKIG
jgi:hypothetical protein